MVVEKQMIQYAQSSRCGKQSSLYDWRGQALIKKEKIDNLLKEAMFCTGELNTRKQCDWLGDRREREAARKT